MLPVLKSGATGEIWVRDAARSMAEQFNLSEEERTRMIPSGTETCIKNRTYWAVVRLVKAGLLKRPRRGYFTITEEGKKVLATNPESIDHSFLRQYPEFEKFQFPAAKKPEVTPQTGEIIEEAQTPAETPAERIDAAYEEFYADLKSEVFQSILEVSPAGFEQMLIRLLISMGYGSSLENAGKHVGGSGDGGIDGVINQDKLGLDIVCIQAKRYAPENTVGRPDVQAFVGSLTGKGANKGVFVTTSSFSRQAQIYAESVPQRLILIDGDRLADLMIEHNVGVLRPPNNPYELKSIDEGFFRDME